MDTATALNPADRGWRMLLRPAVLDRLEQVAIVGLFGLLVWRVFHSGNPYAPLLLIAEASVVLFVLFRRPTTQISVRPGDWALAVTATAAPLLIVPGINPVPQWAMVGVALAVIGNLFQIAAKFSLRRSFGIAPANRGIKSDGFYRLVRHPIYAGYLIVHIGNLFLVFSPINLVIYTIGWWAQILRLQAEERLLSEDPEYRAYKEKVRYRLIPGIF